MKQKERIAPQQALLSSSKPNLIRYAIKKDPTFRSDRSVFDRQHTLLFQIRSPYFCLLK